MVKLIIGGDIVPTDINEKNFESGDISKIIGKSLEEKIKNADIRIFNLETVLIDDGTPICKQGPCLKANSATIKGIAALKPTALGMANNHIMDYGAEGYYKTIKELDKYGIMHVGAGENLDLAREPKILKKDDVVIGLYTCVEHEFTIATETKPGCNPFDPLESYDHVSNLKKKCDIVIVLYHGGKEFYQYGSPELQKICRKFVEKGADYVLCQHSHCIGAEEKYLNGTIVYGQGNAIFCNSNNKIFNTGLFAEIDVLKDEKDVKSKISYIPVELCEEKIEMSKHSDDILAGFYKRSNEMLNAKFVKENYSKFASQLGKQYSVWGSGNLRKNFFVKVLNKISGNTLFKNNYTGQQAIDMINLLQCEAHREVFLTYLRNIVDKERD